MSDPKQIVKLARAASRFESHPADAAALLIDAAAMLFIEARTPKKQAFQRLTNSFDTLSAAFDVAIAHGAPGAKPQ